MKILFLILTVLIGTSCTGKSASDDEKLFTSKDVGSFTKYINHKKMPKHPNLTVDKSIINEDYPIEIALYENNRFFYNLPNLGTGKGTWKYSGGIIELKAKRRLFNMYIEVYGSNADFSKLSIQFRDRFGSNTLKMINNNLQ